MTKGEIGMVEANTERLERIKRQFEQTLIIFGRKNGKTLFGTDIEWLLEKAERALELEQSTTVHVIKRRNGKATVIEYNGERYVYQSETTARGGVRHGKQPHKGQAYKT